MKLKSLFTLSLLLISFTTLMSQSPGRINYQGVVRNSDSSPVTNQNVTFRFSLLDAVDNIVYSETQSLSTNEYGIVICTIGEGNPASFGSVNWSAGEYSLKVECDPAGGTDYTITDTKPINSVPYALYGRDEDADPANELQTISKSGTVVTLSGGGGSFTDAVNDADASISNELISTVVMNGTILEITEAGIKKSVDLGLFANQVLSYNTGTHILSLTGGGSVNLTDLLNDADASTTNEIQTISKTGNLITLSLGGGSVIDEVDDADNDPANELQTISLAGNELSISGTNSVTLAEQTSPWLYSASDIYYNSGKVGIGTDEPLYNFHLMAQPVAGSETILRAMVADDPDGYLEIGNGTTWDENFIPSIIAHNGSDNRQDLFVVAKTTELFDDLGGFPVITFDARRVDGPVVNRPLFQWSNYGSPKMTMHPDGSVGIGTSMLAAKLSLKGDNLATTLDERVNWLRLEGNSGNSDNLYIYHHRYADGTDWNSSEIKIQKQVDSSPMQYISFKGLPSNGRSLEFGYNTTPYMTIDQSGRVGIGTTAPTRNLVVSGNARFSNDLDIWRNNKALNFRQDDSNSWIVNIGNFLNNGADDNGALCLVGQDGIQFRYGIGAGAGILGMSMTNAGKVGVGTISPAGKLQVDGGTEWSDEEPLFEVKNKYGDPVLSVYNNGVRINIEDTDTKGPRGGFAIGGFDRSKGVATVDFMRILPDSIRFNINNDPDAKGPRGGFAIGGFDRSKGEINEDFMSLTPVSSLRGAYNTFLGFESGKVNIGDYNAFVGYRSGYKNLQGQRNVFVGYGTGYNQTWADQNVFIGYMSGYSNIGGDFNVYMGSTAGQNNSSGDQNVFIGNRAAEENIAGSGNVIIGAQAGKRNLGSGNVFLGNWAGYYETGSNRLYIGNKESGDPLIFGYFTDEWVKINGSLRVRDVPSGDYQNLQWNATNGLIYQDNSSARYKENITLLEDKYSLLLETVPMTYTRPENPGVWEIGYIAEDFESLGLKRLVWYDNDGRPDGINYEKIILYSNENIKANRSRITELENEVASLQNQLEEIQQLVSSLLKEQK